MNVIETCRDRSEFLSFCQLVQELISGSVRRHTFTQSELELLFDLQTCKLRRSSKPEALRRYLRAIHQRTATDSTPIRFSTFLERESASRIAAHPPTASEVIPRTAA